MLCAPENVINATESLQKAQSFTFMWNYTNFLGLNYMDHCIDVHDPHESYNLQSFLESVFYLSLPIWQNFLNTTRIFHKFHSPVAKHKLTVHHPADDMVRIPCVPMQHQNPGRHVCSGAYVPYNCILHWLQFRKRQMWEKPIFDGTFLLQLSRAGGLPSNSLLVVDDKQIKVTSYHYFGSWTSQPCTSASRCGWLHFHGTPARIQELYGAQRWTTKELFHVYVSTLNISLVKMVAPTSMFLHTNLNNTSLESMRASLDARVKSNLHVFQRSS